MAIRVFAPAKLNLALHVTGLRADGYHLLDSLVAFASVGDEITVEPADTLTLTVNGPNAYGLSTTDNLTLRAARALHPTRGAHITLTKNLPVASGLGGGSADAAATLRALSQLWSLPLPDPATVLALGADVPVCLAGHPARMQGIGEAISQVALPQAHIVLANCGVAVSTKEVFTELDTRGDLVNRDTSPMHDLPALPDVRALAAFLEGQRNDLEYPAMLVCPEIGIVLFELAESRGCLFSRMSGSGGTCFGLFADEDSAYWAARTLQRRFGHWWTALAQLT